MTDQLTHRLLERFVDAVRQALPVVSVWVHGSLAAGIDFRPGRSDLDLIAVLERPCTPAGEQRLADLHATLAKDVPAAVKLHCGYPPAGELADPAGEHLTWAHGELFRRPVGPVTRRELHEFGRVLYGPPVAELLPPITDTQLKEAIVGELTDDWRPNLSRERLRQDAWVDHGFLALARAAVTLRSGDLISKREALGVLTVELGAPAEVVEDISRRRYADPPPAPASEEWTARRAELALAFLAPALDKVIASYGPRT
ncbi:nucleotidyltransferase domain-containing protein [Streptomyces sp. NPDC051018]|uniref:nucleotidyltransferase domain-containing protein n=1 Tax=Streptomyces sp. NPDC051018 TaxID=3365639 RepID=UPI00379B812E